VDAATEAAAAEAATDERTAAMKWIVGAVVLIGVGLVLQRASSGLTVQEPPRFESDWYNHGTA
jgi:hypothetical protein